jgi:hypothetical protein
MNFRRIEIRRMVRHAENIKDAAEMERVFTAIRERNVSFILKVAGIPGALKDCNVMSVSSDQVEVFSRTPQRLHLRPLFSEIESLEIECNCRLEIEESDEEGRWATI